MVGETPDAGALIRDLRDVADLAGVVVGQRLREAVACVEATQSGVCSASEDTPGGSR
jgi:hypothetical protein